jgi:hypothetical protein
VGFLASKCAEDFHCDELSRTAAECGNGRKDPKAPGGFVVGPHEVAEVYFQTIWSRFSHSERHSEMVRVGASSVEVRCMKPLACVCDRRDGSSGPVGEVALPPYRYGCLASVKYAGL